MPSTMYPFVVFSLFAALCAYFFQQWVTTPALSLTPWCLSLGLRCPHFTLSDLKGFSEEPWKQPFERLALEFVNQGQGSAMMVSVNFQGRTVVDYAIGTPRTSEIPIHPENTLMQVWSTGKNAEAIAFLLLVDRGLIDDLNDPIMKYWPEYGKPNATIADILRHESPTYYTEPQITYEDMFDSAKISQKYEQQPSLWEKHGERKRIYHVCNRGTLLSQIVERVDPQRRTLGQFIHEEIAVPLSGVFYPGCLSPSLHSAEEISELSRRFERNYADNLLRTGVRVLTGARLLPVDQKVIWNVLTGNPLHKSMMQMANVGVPDFIRNFAKDEYHRIAITSCNAVSNAKSLSSIMGLVANQGNVNGKQIISSGTLEKNMFQNVTEKMDQFTTNPFRFASSGLGSAARLCGGDENVFVGDNAIIGWAGHGGQLAVAWPAKKLAFAFITPTMELSAAPRRACKFWHMARKIAEQM